jgi:hypothetical protein
LLTLPLFLSFEKNKKVFQHPSEKGKSNRTRACPMAFPLPPTHSMFIPLNGDLSSSPGPRRSPTAGGLGASGTLTTHEPCQPSTFAF